MLTRKTSPQNIKRGQIYWVNFEPVRDSEQGQIRPALVVQNDVGNRFSPITIVVPITSDLSPKPYPTNVRVEAGEGGLPKDSEILCGQIRAVSKPRLRGLLGAVSNEVMEKVEQAILVCLDMRHYRKVT